MHRAFLHRYFHLNHWTSDLLAAFFSVKPSWEVGELTKAFVDVCCDLEAPRGSASELVTWLNYLVGQEKLALEAKVLTRIGLGWAKPSRSLKAAISWSMACRAIENQTHQEMEKVFARSEDVDSDHVAHLRTIQFLRRSRATRLGRINKSFRLKP